MRKVINFVVMAIFFVITIAPVNARMCERDWLSVWRNASGMLQNHMITFTRGTQSGTWAITANQNNTGRQTITGMAICNSSTTSDPHDTGANGSNCWCRLVTPSIGHWRFLNPIGNVSDCALACAQACAACALFGSHDLCTRATLLIVP